MNFTLSWIGQFPRNNILWVDYSHKPLPSFFYIHNPYLLWKSSPEWHDWAQFQTKLCIWSVWTQIWATLLNRCLNLTAIVFHSESLWGTRGILLRLLAAQVLIVQLIIHTSWWRSSEGLYLIVLSAACCCVQKSQVQKVHLFLSEVLICIFKHSVHALPVAAQWLMFKHIFAFEKKVVKRRKYTFDQRNANENLTELQLLHSCSKCWCDLLAREPCLWFIPSSGDFVWEIKEF